ncbi:hypothetical protein [Candidatus Endomicrobiellum agilis]|uniref:hypothetical protein n=1 Tax=Candidatus Endomicrobiellum agilis TaxID=3238957 RepID=UPI003586029D|nr:hypothetical protein [Endomicrobium sp.]
MKKIICICICICICSSFGCGRLQSGGNAENLDDTSRVVKHTPLSSDPANLPVPTPPPIPNPTVQSNRDIAFLDEFCGKGNGVPYFCYSALSSVINSVLISIECSSHCASMFLRILRMFSVFSFPVYVYLTNPSFLSKSKASLSLLAVDTCLSLLWFVTKNPSVISCIWYAQFILEVFRVVAYPHIRGMFSLDFHLIKRAILK